MSTNSLEADCSNTQSKDILEADCSNTQSKGICGTCKTRVAPDDPRVQVNGIYYHNIPRCMNTDVAPDLKLKGPCGSCGVLVLGSQHRILVDKTYFHDPSSAYTCDVLKNCEKTIILAMKSAK